MLYIDENKISYNIIITKDIKELKFEQPRVQNNINSINDHINIIKVWDINVNDSQKTIFNNDKLKEIVKEPNPINKNDI